MEIHSFNDYVSSAGTYSDVAAGDPLVYGYHENIALALGLGFDPRDVTQYKRPCISGTHVQLDAGAIKTALSVSYVRNLDQMNLSMKVDSKADASYLGFKGGARFAMDTSYAFSANSITAILTAETDFGRWGLDASAKLNDDAKALLTDGGKFAEVCGTRFVIAERRGASVSAVITLRSVCDEFKSSLESEFSGGGSWGVMSGSAQAKFALGLSV